MTERPLPRNESELLRVALAKPAALRELAVEDFSDPRLRAAFSAVSEQFAGAGEESRVDISSVADPALADLLRRLAMDQRPLPDGWDILQGMRVRRLESDIDRLEAEIAELEPGSEPHSNALRELIALQQQKRTSQDL
jgi:hypothetical protein